MKRYKILIVAPFFPFPANDGGKICVFGFIDYLRRYHEFHLYVPIRTIEEEIQLDKLRTIWNDVVIHVVNQIPVHSKRSILTKLIKRILPTRLVEISRIIKLNETKVNKNPYRFYENSFNTFPFTPFDYNYINQLKLIVEFHSFDIIQCELTPMLNLIHIFPVTAKRIFVQIESRQDVLKDYGKSNTIENSYSEYISENVGFIEYSYMSLYDAVFTLNESDKKKIKEKIPSLRVFNSPFAILDNQVENMSANSYSPKHLLFIGSENHFPNYDGLKWFLKEVTPQLEVSPLLYVTGSWTDLTKREFLKYYNKIHFTGFVENVTEYLLNSISIVPIRIGGGGIRTKLLFAMANNSPVVTTSIGAVGIEGKEDVNFLIADTAKEFAKKILIIISNTKVAKEITEQAYQLFQTTYSQSVVSEKRNEFYVKIMDDLPD